MSAFLVYPRPFTVTTSTGWNVKNPVSNLNIDPVGLVARSTGNTASFTVNLGSVQIIDTLALIGSNLPSTATVKVVAGSYDSGAVAAWTGDRASEITAKTIIRFAPISVSTVTVTITSNAPFEAQRLIVGRAVETEGIDQNCEMSFEDQSVLESGPGFTSVDLYSVLMSWKVKMSWIPDVKWRSDFLPLFNRVGLSRAVLFVPLDDPSRYQHEAVFGRITGKASGEHNNHNNWVVGFTVTSLSA